MPNNSKSQKTNQPLSGVVCNAVNCTFHENHEECLASEITIDPSSALTSKQTACMTFKAKDRDTD